MKGNILFNAILLLFTKASIGSSVTVSKTFGFNEIDATANIQNAIDAPYDTIVVDFVGKDWIVRPIFAKSNKVIVFQSGVVLMAKQGEYRVPRTSMFNITNVSNVTLLGYGATFRMRKADYQNTSLYEHSEWRHALDIQAFVGKPVANIVVKGLHFERSGGDGICISGISGYPDREPVQPTNILIQDVVCEDNHRQGISVTGGVDIKIVNSVLKDTKGTPPQAGIDWEPDWERLLNVSMTNCYITNNRVTGIEMYLYRPAWKGAKTIAATFDNCHVDSDDGVQGIALKINNVQDSEGSDGTIIFNDCSFRNKTIYSTVSISDKSALKAKVILNRCFLEQTNSKGSVISLQTSNVDIKNEITFGGIELNDCTVNDKYNRNFMTFEDNSNTTRGIRDVKGSIIVNNPFGANYTLGAVTQNITLKVIENKSTPPSINITQPIVLQKIEQGKNFTVSATAADIDAGTSNGAGIQRVIFEIQYANDKVYTFEDSEAPYTFSVATATWQKGIYLVKAIATSISLSTKNISVVPIEIIGSNDLTTALFESEKGYTSISIFPNPSKTELIISGTISARTTYEIINFEGKVLQADTIVGKVISIFNLKSGSYLIKFKTEAGESVQKFVKE